MIGLQAFINIGVSSGLLPTKGLTLPLMSYGGSSLIISAVIIAILLRVHKETQIALIESMDEKNEPQSPSVASPLKQRSWFKGWKREVSI